MPEHANIGATVQLLQLSYACPLGAAERLGTPVLASHALSTA